MLTLPGTVRVFVALDPCDLRKGFDKLCAAVRARFDADPASGHLFCFRNRRGDQVKVLWFDRTGYATFHKRLERGTFQVMEPSGGGGRAAEIDVAALLLMLEGLDLRDARQRLRWRRLPSPIMASKVR